MQGLDKRGNKHGWVSLGGKLHRKSWLFCTRLTAKRHQTASDTGKVAQSQVNLEATMQHVKYQILPGNLTRCDIAQKALPVTRTSILDAKSCDCKCFLQTRAFQVPSRVIYRGTIECICIQEQYGLSFPRQRGTWVVYSLGCLILYEYNNAFPKVVFCCRYRPGCDTTWLVSVLEGLHTQRLTALSDRRWLVCI
jgi:hypothetical protein